MELLSRQRGDILVRPGECLDIRRRLRRIARRHDLGAVVVSAFDARTRMLPFYYASTHMAPAGARAVGAALFDSGIEKVRVVCQQWNRNFRPSAMALDGRMPDLLLISSMQIHGAQCTALIRDACRIDPVRRPLIIAGGPKVIYEPWSVFDLGGGAAADVAVTGEEYVLLELLEVLLGERAAGEPLRSAFARARDGGALEAVPGLVYAAGEPPGRDAELIDTGTQRLVGDLDELPHPAIGLALLEPPSRKATLAARPMEPSRVRRRSPIVGLVFTSGCRFHCPYCPIPAYNQRQHRLKSPARIADEMTRLNRQFGLRYFFGTDDNFFNDRARSLEIVEALARAEIAGRPLGRRVGWGTEVTVHDTLGMVPHLPTVRRAGAVALWLGVEDMTATFVRKGQSVEKTTRAFALLRGAGILPVPMLMHHDGQPLLTRGSDYGLINQVRLLSRAGAVDVQILSEIPAVGSRVYEDAFTSGRVIGAAGGRAAEPYMLDGNYVLASREREPWRMQLRVAAALAFQYNPVRLLATALRVGTSPYLIGLSMQASGVWGLINSLPRMLGWASRLMRGGIARRLQPPGPTLPIRRLGDRPARTSSCVGELLAV